MRMKTAGKKRGGRIIRTRRAGVIYIIVSIVLGVVSVNSANNLLYLVTAMMLAYMLASGLTGRANIRGASVSVSFPDEIYAQVPCTVEVSVSNKNRFTPVFLIEVALEQENRETHKTHEINEINGKRAGVLFPVIQPGHTESRTLFTTFPSRGRRSFERIELSSTYPFNFFVRYWPVDADPEALVFPYPLTCGPEAVFSPANEDDDGEAPDPLSETDIVGVRPYVEGDSMKRIHWKSSARTGKLKTRLYDGTSSRRRNIIDLDRLTAGGVERGLSMAAYAIADSIKSRLPVGMRVGEEFIPPSIDYAHKKNLLARLALYRER